MREGEREGVKRQREGIGNEGSRLSLIFLQVS